MGDLTKAQRRDALLRDIARTGAPDAYDHLRSHGHHPSTIRAAEEALLIALVTGRTGKRCYDLTESGQAALSQAEQKGTGNG